MSPRALLLTDPLGVGKTTVAAAIGDLLRERQAANAVGCVARSRTVGCGRL